MRLLWVLAILLAACCPAQAQTGSAKTPSALTNEINTLAADNTTNAFTLQSLRQITLDLVQSMLNSVQYGATAPIQFPQLPASPGNIWATINGIPVNGDAACFSGTLLVDCGNVAPGPWRIVLSVAKTLYVNVNSTTGNCNGVSCGAGNDGGANTCLLTATPCKTIQYAISQLVKYDLGATCNNIIQLADGTYNESVQFLSYAAGGNQCPHNLAVIQGNTSNRDAVTIAPASGDCFDAVGIGSEWSVLYMKLICAGSGLRSDYRGRIIWNQLNFTGGNFGIQAGGTGALVEEFAINGTPEAFTISGNYNEFIAVNQAGQVLFNNPLGTLTGTPAWTTAFMAIATNGTLHWGGMSLSGAATGVRFTQQQGGQFDLLYGGDPNTLIPGTVNGTAFMYPIAGGPSYTSLISANNVIQHIGGITLLPGGTSTTLTAAQCPWVMNTAVLSAPITWTLPVASTWQSGLRCVLGDFGGIAGANTLRIASQGTDHLLGNGVVANAYTITVSQGSVTVQSDGNANWFLVSKN